jgi:outer membrane protein TolC
MSHSMKTMILTAQNGNQNDRRCTGVPGSVRRMQLRAKICEAGRPNAGAFKEMTPEQSKETDGWKTAEPKDDMIRGQWWEMFHEPELNAFESQVVVSNQTVAAALANFLAARAVVKQSRSQYFPTVTANPSVTRSRQSSSKSIKSSPTSSTSPNTRCHLTPPGSWISGAAFATR